MMPNSALTVVLSQYGLNIGVRLQLQQRVDQILVDVEQVKRRKFFHELQADNIGNHKTPTETKGRHIYISLV